MKPPHNAAALAVLVALFALPGAATAAGEPGGGASDPSDPAKARSIAVLLARVEAASAEGSAEQNLEICDKADLCLHDGLFAVWGQLGPENNFVNTEGVTLPETNQGGLLYAWSNDNPEILVKVLEGGCDFNGHWWVFIGTATDQPFSVVVKHLPTDRTKAWFSGDIPLQGARDIEAFPCER